MIVAVGIVVEVGITVGEMDVAVGSEEHEVVTNMAMINVKKMRRMAWSF